MNELSLHPNVYATGASGGLVSMLERVWIRDHSPGDGHFYIVSGFANYNGGVRFFETFRDHIHNGGRATAFLGGSTRQRLTSKQVVEGLLDVGVDVHLVNRKRILHAKSYGCADSAGQRLVVTSGNFTGPGMSQNVEMALLMDRASTADMGFSWETMIERMQAQNWDIHQPRLDDLTNPAWQLLYDEQARDIILDETDEVSMVVRLSHADTARINAEPGSNAGKGSQYFWLSKDCYDFFPALTIRNVRGAKATFSALIKIYFVDINQTDKCRVTFEAENNLDFRLGTGPLRYTGVAKEGDLAVISRLGETDYQIRIARQGTDLFRALSPYSINFIGHQGKTYGFLSNSELEAHLGLRLAKRRN